MDEFLIPHANFKRLYEEYKKYGSLSIGLDFDNTIYDFHKKGYDYSRVISLCRAAVEELGMKVIIFSANPDHDLILKHCETINLRISGINTDGVDLGWSSRKPFYSILLDDRAGLVSAYEDLSMLVDTLVMEKEENLWVAGEGFAPPLLPNDVKDEL